jgi:hypothetical protein
MLLNEASLLPVSRTVNILIVVNVQASCYTDVCRNLEIGGDLTFLHCKNILQNITAPWMWSDSLDKVKKHK